MNKNIKQAQDFLSSCNATMEIKFMGLECPKWDSKPHATYDCTIKTPRGEMKVHFYDSAIRTKKLSRLNLKMCEIYPKGLETIGKNLMPTEYDILACVSKYDVGSMEDFFSEFGFEIKSVKDMTNFFSTYNAVVEEYRDICRCFTSEQIEAMWEIQ